MSRKPDDSRIHYDFPFRLRLIHREYAQITLERKGRWIIFDPYERPSTDQIVVITGPGQDRLKGSWEAVKAGVKPTVIAPDGVIDYLTEAGTLEGGPAPRVLDGVDFSCLSYAPHRAALPGLRAGPLSMMRAFAGRARAIAAEPQVFCLRFEDGSRLLHLDLALHRDTQAEWMERAVSLFGGADWVIAGVPYGEADAVVRLLPRFQPAKILLTELVNTERKAKNLPIELITPTRDRLLQLGLETHVFAPHASYRFE
jgi:hypothetical protein